MPQNLLCTGDMGLRYPHVGIVILLLFVCYRCDEGFRNFVVVENAVMSSCRFAGHFASMQVFF